MQIDRIQTNNIKNNVGFKSFRVPKRPIKEVTDATLKNVSTAIAATGIAILMLENSIDDYTKSIAIAIDRAALNEEEMDYINEMFQIYPVLADSVLSAKNKRKEIRELSKNSLNTITEAYEINPEMTIDLLYELDDKGRHKYTYLDIKHIVKANDLSPELNEYARKNPHFINKLANKVNLENNPVFGISDIKQYAELYELDPSFVTKASQQLQDNGQARFTGEELKYIVTNKTNDKDDLLNILLEERKRPETTTPGIYRFNGEEIVKIHKANKPELAKSYINAHRNGGYTRYNPKQILFLINSPLEEIVKEYASAFGLEDVIKFRGGVSEEEFKQISNLRDKRKRPLLDGYELNRIRPESLKNKLILEDIKRKYAKLDTTDENYSQIYELAKINPEVVDLIFDKTYTILKNDFIILDAHFNFNTNEGMRLVDLAKEDPKLVEECLKRANNMKIDKNNDDATCYIIGSSDRIVANKMINLIENIIEKSQSLPKEKIEELLNKTTKYGVMTRPKYNTQELYNEIIKLSNGNK